MFEVVIKVKRKTNRTKDREIHALLKFEQSKIILGVEVILMDDDLADSDLSPGWLSALCPVMNAKHDGEGTSW